MGKPPNSSRTARKTDLQLAPMQPLGPPLPTPPPVILTLTPNYNTPYPTRWHDLGCRTPPKNPYCNKRATGLFGHRARYGSIFATLTCVIPFFSVTSVPFPFSFRKHSRKRCASPQPEYLCLYRHSETNQHCSSLNCHQHPLRGAAEDPMKGLTPTPRHCHQPHPQANILVVPVQ